MKIVIIHPTSNQNNRAVLKGLEDAGLIKLFFTCIAVFPKSTLDYLSNIGPLKELSRRRFDTRLRNKTKTQSVFELFRLIANKLNIKMLTKHEEGVFSVDAIYTNIDKKAAKVIKNTKSDEINAVYAYEDGALNSFKAAKKNNIECIYDLPIGYWKAARSFLAKEIELWPEWKDTLHGFKDSNAKLKRKDKELYLADRIFVASSFTAKTLSYYTGKLAPVKVIPYGFPKPFENRIYNDIENRPIKLLFVGGLSQRKGIANMFMAIDHLQDRVELTVVGRKPTNNCKVLNEALEKYHYIPSLSHADVLKLMREHDIFLFPSLFEGFGLVITEAMSQGTPVITTDRTAGPDLITHNEDGWIIEAGSTEALQNCIDRLVKHPKQIITAGKAALKTAKQRPWETYGKELATAILNK